MSDKNIYQRIAAVMTDVAYVQKDRKVDTYMAVTHDQVVSVIRASLVKHGIVVCPEQQSGELLIKRDGVNIKMHLYTGTYSIHFVNVDKPEDRATVVVQAHANDNGDKAPGKAMTYATKTAMLKIFTLETGENDESRAADNALDVDAMLLEVDAETTLESLRALSKRFADTCSKAKDVDSWKRLKGAIATRAEELKQ